MTSSDAADHPDVTDVLAIHLAVIAELHEAAVAHIASLAEPWVRSVGRHGVAGPHTEQLVAVAVRPPVPAVEALAA